MKVSYKKLWKLLIDRDMSRTELRLRAGISSVSLAKLGKNEGVTTNVLVKICSALDCNIGDIMDVVPERGKYEILLFDEADRIKGGFPEKKQIKCRLFQSRILEKEKSKRYSKTQKNLIRRFSNRNNRNFCQKILIEVP